MFKFITFIPFTIFKLNCKIYKKTKNILDLNYKNKSSFKAIIDNILLNLYLDGVSDEIQNIQKYKIIIKKNSIEFNPSKKKQIFKNIFDYFSSKKNIEDVSDFVVFKNKKENNTFIYKHISKIYKVFKEDSPLKDKIIFTETKAKELLDKNGNKIKGKLNDIGYKDENIKTNKVGPIIAETNNKILDELSGKDIKYLATSKNRFSWNLLLEVYYNKETLKLDDKNVIVKEKEKTLKEFIMRNFKYLNDGVKKFIEMKEKLDLQNFDILKNMSEKEYEDSIVSDYDSWKSSNSDYYSDFYKKQGYRRNNFTDNSDEDW